MQDNEALVGSRATAFDDLRRSLSDSAGYSQTPGLQVVVVDATGPVLQHHQGLAKIASESPMRDQSTLMAYSMSKTGPCP